MGSVFLQEKNLCENLFVFYLKRKIRKKKKILTKSFSSKYFERLKQAFLDEQKNWVYA